MVMRIMLDNGLLFLISVGNEVTGEYCCDLFTSLKDNVLEALEKEFTCCICNEMFVEVSAFVLSCFNLSDSILREKPSWIEFKMTHSSETLRTLAIGIAGIKSLRYFPLSPSLLVEL